MDLVITVKPKYDKLVCFFQDQVSMLAMEKLDTDHNIYFDKIPLTDRHDLMWDNEINGWVLRYQLET